MSKAGAAPPPTNMRPFTRSPGIRAENFVCRPRRSGDGAPRRDPCAATPLTSSDPAFAVVCKGGAVRVLSIDRFIADFPALPRTTSHRQWAESFGLDRGDRLVVRTVEGRAFVIDPHDGRLIAGSFAH